MRCAGSAKETVYPVARVKNTGVQKEGEILKKKSAKKKCAKISARKKRLATKGDRANSSNEVRPKNGTNKREGVSRMQIDLKKTRANETSNPRTVIGDQGDEDNRRREETRKKKLHIAANPYHEMTRPSQPEKQEILPCRRKAAVKGVGKSVWRGSGISATEKGVKEKKKR